MCRPAGVRWISTCPSASGSTSVPGSSGWFPASATAYGSGPNVQRSGYQEGPSLVSRAAYEPSAANTHPAGTASAPTRTAVPAPAVAPLSPVSGGALSMAQTPVVIGPSPPATKLVTPCAPRAPFISPIHPKEWPHPGRPPTAGGEGESHRQPRRPLSPGSLGPVPRLSEVLTALDALWPRSLAEQWDAVGTVCGDPDAGISRVLFAVDPVQEVADEAIRTGADLLVTHHPCTCGAPPRWPPTPSRAASSTA